MGKYRRYQLALKIALAIALLVTCGLSWTVASGSAMLNRFNELSTRTVQQVDASAGTEVTTATAEDGEAAAARREKLRVQLVNLYRWMTVHEPLLRLAGGYGQRPYYVARKEPRVTRVNLESAAVLIGVLAGTILPIAYGLLGAAAAVVRRITLRLNANELLPRHIMLGPVQLLLGAVIGACVGLFATGDGSEGTEGNGLLGAVSLSTSALCFLAGFGVEGVFRALEELIRRVFPSSEDGTRRAS